ncbi:polysaccharide biosynthesis protein [Erythrobacter sp. NFXS35]|uniref:polysaccharide biosynthesis protein n=1 Tax=Erythrobacter sp. NFXS35 TaxID=2818436 RepID=UPI0032DEFB14
MKPHKRQLSQLRRSQKVAIQLLCDTAVIIAAFIAAMLLRLDEAAFQNRPEVWPALAIALISTLLALNFLGVYSTLVRFVTGKILMPVVKASLVGIAALYLAGFALEGGIPRSVPIMFGVMVFLGIGGSRFVARTLLRQPIQRHRRPVIIYGAGEAGLQLLNSLFHGKDYAPVALIDDEPSLQGLTISGLRVHSAERIAELVEATGAQAVLLAMPRLSREKRREIVAGLEDMQLEIKTIPPIANVINGTAKITQLRNVRAEDLLGRDPIEPIADLLGRNIAGKTVMVSGAGGSIGSELCRQIMSQRPAKLILFEISEFALYTIETELAGIAAQSELGVEIIPVLGSVQDSQRVEAVLKSFAVNTIYHAAAYKHVPLVEDNIIEGIRNNIYGTYAIACEANKCGVEHFILISTDKAVRPTNIMGATKRIAELVCQALSREYPNTVFSMVRFGNVLGSSGSVIPKFRAQIEMGGPITVTHVDITRYFMTIPEASQLVIQAGAMARGGDVFILDMGDPVKIMDLAIEMIKLHGLVPSLSEQSHQPLQQEGVIPICVTGLRKGEKLFEELLIGNNPSPTIHPRIMSASERSLPIADLVDTLKRLGQACEEYDVAKIRSILKELPIDYMPAADADPTDLDWGRDEIGQHAVLKQAS